MEKLLVIAALTMTPTPKHQSPIDTQVAVVCFFTGQRVSGMNKICFYDCMGDRAAMTINSVSICPLSITR